MAAIEKTPPKAVYQFGERDDSLQRLKNHQDIPFEIIEIQTGIYLDEEDIIRLEDNYQRN